MPGRHTRKSSPGTSSAFAHQRGQNLPDALNQLQSGVGKLTWGERLDILDAWVQVLDGAYAHLPLKRALYGFDPIRAIEHLRGQVPSLSDIQFHRELTCLINRLRDAHTHFSRASRALKASSVIGTNRTRSPNWRRHGGFASGVNNLFGVRPMRFQPPGVSSE